MAKKKQEKPLKDGKKTDRDKKGRFTEGNSGGPGYPKGKKNYLTLLEEALEKEAQKAGITYWEKLAQWCFTNPKSAVAVLKKFIPDRQQTELDIPEPIKIIIEDADKESKEN